MIDLKVYIFKLRIQCCMLLWTIVFSRHITVNIVSTDFCRGLLYSHPGERTGGWLLSGQMTRDTVDEQGKL